MQRSGFVSTTVGLDRGSFPMRLYAKALQHGTWHPDGIDLRADREHWAGFDAQQRSLLLRLTALFQGGEEAVTLDVLPLIAARARAGHLEEEIFLATFLADEAKHTVFFRRVLDEVMEVEGSVEELGGEAYRAIFHAALPEALQALSEDDSPAALARAAVTYNMIVEGVLAETGYHAFFSTLQANEVMPGVCEGIGWLKRDESRHIAYGIYLLGRLLSEDGSLWEQVEAQMSDLAPVAIGVVQEIFDAYDPVPFGLDEQAFVGYALGQLQRRLQRLEAARGEGVEFAESAASEELQEG